MTFDMAATFGDDYLYFYEESIDDEHSDSDTAEIISLLTLSPGSRVLDAPCGHGRNCSASRSSRHGGDRGRSELWVP